MTTWMGRLEANTLIKKHWNEWLYNNVSIYVFRAPTHPPAEIKVATYEH